MKKAFVLGVAVVVGLLVAAVDRGFCAEEQGAPAAAPVKTGSLEVTVVFAAGKPMKSAVVFAADQERTVTSFTEPVRFDGIPEGKLGVAVEAEPTTGLTKGTKRFLGLTEVQVQAGAVQQVTVSVAKVDSLEAFCLGCHPNPRDPKVKVKPGQIVRDIHVTGKEFPAKQEKLYMGQWKGHHENIAKLEKEGKPHNLPMPLEERVVKVGGKDVKKLFYTCETCHTLHKKTPWGYERAPFRTKADLCIACHF